MTKDEFSLMEQSVLVECHGMPENTGVSVALWRLRELIAGYKFYLETVRPLPFGEHL